VILFFDTETNGKAIQGAHESAPGQPRVCEVGALLTDDEGNDVNFFSMIVRPDGWTIPPELTQIHGISQEHAERVGIPILTVLSAFRFLARPALRYVAHSAQFDRDRATSRITSEQVHNNFQLPAPSKSIRWRADSHFI
jgi:DNA polymerase-3 subunit epsilon